MSENRALRFAKDEEPRPPRPVPPQGFDEEGLRALKIAVFGAGALGNSVLQMLALLGVGRVLIVDFDRVEAANLSRSPLFRPGDAGRLKADVARERLFELNPWVEVTVCAEDLHYGVGPGTLAQYDCALSCVDSIDARLGIDRLCQRAGIPWWNGGLGAFSAEVQGFDPFAGPCYACGLSETAQERERVRWSCQSGRPLGPEPTARVTTAIAASFGGSLLVFEALRALGAPPAADALLAGERILFDATHHTLTRLRVERDPRCPHHDDRAGSFDHAVEIARHQTVESLVRGLQLSPDRTDVHLSYDLIRRAQCACPRNEAEFLPLRRALWPCPVCEKPFEGIENTASFRANDPWAKVPFERLRLPRGGELILTHGDQILIVRLIS